MALLFKKILILSILFSVSEIVYSQKDWREIITADDLYENYPGVVQNMFKRFDLEHAGLEKVKVAHEKGDFVEASVHLLEYYKTSSNAGHLRQAPPDETSKTIAQIEPILKNLFVIQNVQGEVPWGEDGHRDWDYKGPNSDEEWAWLSNRHHQLKSVFNAYSTTGNLKYIQYIDLFLRDFILKSHPYPAKKSRGSIWRGLEVSFRSKVWTRIFYGLLNNHHLSPATQLLLLSSLPDHADYNYNYHAKGGNWITMELSALAVVAINFPEYKKSDEWSAYALKKMNESIKDQVYQDGVQKELASHYHYGALKNFEAFKATYETGGKKFSESYTQTLENMYDYLAKSIRPNGFGVLNNDSDLDFNRERLQKAAKEYQRPDWEYRVTNGKFGTKPTGQTSTFFPWAGQLISRSNYTDDAHWSFFDIGPWGTGHQHNDKLHISISAFGKDLLVDAGRFAYRGKIADKFRSYARSSAAHNTILIDHKGQENGTESVEEPLSNHTYKITDKFDFATSSFDAYKGVEGEAKHIRSLYYVRGEFWVVVDRIITDRPRHIEILWHWHPDCKVEAQNLIVETNNRTGNLAIIPVGDTTLKVELIKGREKPILQGWYSPMYNSYTPNIVSSYSTNIESSTTFVWILQPSKGKVSLLESEIISESESSIEIKVNSKTNSYQINIPYFNSEEATLIPH